MQLNDLRVNLTLDNSGFRLSVADSTRILRQFEQRLGSTADATRRTEGAFSSFGSRAHRMIQTIGLARFALMDLNDIMLAFPKAILTSAGEIERMTKLMEGLSTQADSAARKIEAASNVKFVFDMAQNAPFEVKALTDTLVKFKTGGIDPTNGSMQALVDSVAKFGGSSEQLHRASIAIQQMSGKGVISMEELRQQLGEAVPTAMNAMAVGMKMSMAQLTTAVSKGTVASNTALKKMLAVMSVDNAGAANEMMTTWTGMLERLKTKWEMWKLTVAGEGMADGTKGALKDLIDLFGSPGAASFGRKVGEAMASATMAVIDFTKTVSRMWEEIKTAGMALLFYFGASKLAPMIAGAGAAIKGYYNTILAGAANVRAANVLDAQARNAHLLAEARAADAAILRNNRIIASEQGRFEAGRVLRARELAETIAANRAIMGVYAQRQTANAAAMAAALPSSSAAIRAVASRTATAAQDLEAQSLLRHADAARVSQTEITRRTAALQAQNLAMAAERTLLTTTAGAMTANSAARASQNILLGSAADRYRRLAAEVTVANGAMHMMRAAGATVVSAMSSMLFSMNGLILVIMAGAWAWSHFSDKAKKAAKDAEIAHSAAKRAQEGKFNDDTVKASEDNLKEKEAELVKLRDQVKAAKELKSFYANGAVNAEVDAKRVENEKKIERLEKDIPIYRINLERERTRVARKNGSDDGRAIVDEYTTTVNTQLDKAKVSVANINKKYAELTVTQGKLTPEQKKDREQALFDARTTELLNATRMWDAKGKELETSLAGARKVLQQKGLTQVQIAEAEREVARQEAALNGAMSQRSNSADALAAMNAPNDILGGDKPPKPTGRPKKESVMDGVLSAIASERKGVSRAETAMNSLLEDVVDVQRLKEDFQREIDVLNENDKDKKVSKKHSAADEKELIDLKTQKVIVDRLKNLYGGLAKQRLSIEEEYRLTIEKMSSGNFQLQGKGQAERVVEQLQEELRRAGDRAEKIPGEAERIKSALDDASKILYAQQGVTGGNMFEENKRGIDSMTVSNETNDRGRMQKQQALELNALREKHASQLVAVKQNREMVKRLTEQHNQEDLAIATKHANEMKTPLEKLADSWADVTRNMETNTERWASSTMDAFVELTSGGKVEFKSLLASMLKDYARMQLQNGFGDLVKTGMSKAGSFLSSTFAGRGDNGGGAGGENGGEAASAISTLLSSFGKLASGSNTAAESVGTGLAGSAADATAGLIESAVQGAVTMTADQVATAAMTELAVAATFAAAALIEAAAAAAGQAVSSMFANGGIMSSSGSLPLNMYRNGGIADRPQLAVFGEGSMNEAYVPLPDGRSIPVTMKGGGGGGGQNIEISIVVHSDGREEGSSSETETAGAWTKMAARVKDVVRQEIAGQQRPGGMLYK